MMREGIDVTSVEGAEDLPNEIPNILVTCTAPKYGVPVQWWRSVATPIPLCRRELFDEMAHAAAKTLTNSDASCCPAIHGAKGSWSWPLKKPAGAPVAGRSSTGNSCACIVWEFRRQVAEVSVSKDGEVRVHRVVCAG